jgi:hypothetical protein
MRAELEGRGETLEVPKPPRPQRGPVPSPSYRATHRVQMLTVGEERPDQPHDILAVHEDRGDGTALCGSSSRARPRARSSPSAPTRSATHHPRP